LQKYAFIFLLPSRLYVVGLLYSHCGIQQLDRNAF
jgi:hypothetical protein